MTDNGEPTAVGSDEVWDVLGDSYETERRLITGGFFLARRRFWHDEARNPDFTHPRALVKHPPPALHASRRQYWYEIANTRVLQTAHSADMIGTPVRE